MIQTGFEKRVQVQQILANQLPDFIRAESPRTLDFLKQYYVSQEHQSGATDLADNLDQYIKLDNLTPEVISGKTTLYSGISSTTDTVQVYSTKSFPNEYGLFKIDDEIFTYTGITTNTFTGVIRGFSGISSYRTDLNAEELLFEETSQASHDAGKEVINLSSNFLKEFYKKLKFTLTPGLEDVDFVSDLDVNNFINTQVPPMPPQPEQEKPDPAALLAQAEAQKAQVQAQKAIIDAETDRMKIIMDDDRNRDIEEAQIRLKAAELQAKYGTQVNIAEINAIMERDREIIREAAKINAQGLFTDDQTQQ